MFDFQQFPLLHGETGKLWLLEVLVLFEKRHRSVQGQVLPVGMRHTNSQRHSCINSCAQSGRKNDKGFSHNSGMGMEDEVSLFEHGLRTLIERQSLACCHTSIVRWRVAR